MKDARNLRAGGESVTKIAMALGQDPKVVAGWLRTKGEMNLLYYPTIPYLCSTLISLKNRELPFVRMC